MDVAVLDDNNIVVNIIIVESVDLAKELTGAKCVAVTADVKIGGTWDGKKFTEPSEAWLIEHGYIAFEEAPAPTE